LNFAVVEGAFIPRGLPGLPVRRGWLLAVGEKYIERRGQLAAEGVLIFDVEPFEERAVQQPTRL
jgi:hypothetical protein